LKPWNYLSIILNRKVLVHNGRQVAKLDRFVDRPHQR
jgi:hypothetical protein